MKAIDEDKACSSIIRGIVEMPWVRHCEGMCHGLDLIQGPAVKIVLIHFL